MFLGVGRGRRGLRQGVIALLFRGRKRFRFEGELLLHGLMLCLGGAEAAREVVVDLAL